MPQSPADGVLLRGLSVVVSNYDRAPLGEELPVGALADLPLALDRRDEFTRTLRALGYECTELENLDADELGTRTRQWLRRKPEGPEVRIVHVLGHGRGARASGKLTVVGRDGNDTTDTTLEVWLHDAADARHPVPTLFVFDLCGSGELTKLDWDSKVATGERSAWVIASSQPASLSFNCRLTRAAARVLERVGTGALRDIDASVEVIPLERVGREIRREVLKLIEEDGGRPQGVTGTRLSFTDDVPEIPFFRNPLYEHDNRRALREAVDVAVRPYLDAVDRLLDPVHFISRARGLGLAALPEAASCFTGRHEQLTQLAAWMDSGDGLRVVTGHPGVGKSALLGVLVCAAHPVLRKSSAWHAAMSTAPSRNDHLAAVHARQRTVDQIVSSLGRQLGLVISGTRPAAAAVAAIVARDVQPVVVIDALDEAADSGTLLDQLLLPLARARRPDGRAACRLLVGARPWTQFVRLFEAAEAGGGLIDLSTVPPQEVRANIVAYVNSLLTVADRYADAASRPIRDALASSVADALSATDTAPAAQRWGEFLVAGLYVNHLLTSQAAIRTVEEARARTANVPRTLPEVLELDLTERATPWLRAVLAAVAWARGDGMPATCIRACLDAIMRTRRDRPDDEPLTDTAIMDALREAQFYLRTSVDTDGSTLYRLFHQGLADDLRQRAIAEAHTTGRGVDRAIYQELLSLVPVDANGARQWELAGPYLLRNLAGHAVAAGRLDAVLEDADFLVRSDPGELAPRLRHAKTQVGRKIATAFLMSYVRHVSAGDEQRRMILAIDAARQGLGRLAEDLSRPPGLPALPWRAGWATAPADAGTAKSLAGHRGSVGHVRCVRHRHRDLVVTAGTDGEIRVWNLVTGEELAMYAGRPSPITALAALPDGDRLIGVASTQDGHLQAIDLATGRLVRSDPDGQSIVALECVRAGERLLGMALRPGRGVSVWDIDTGESVGLIPGNFTEFACAALPGGPLVVTASDDGVLSVWDPLSGERKRQLTAIGRSGAVTCLIGGGAERTNIAAIGADRRVHVWDAATGELVWSRPERPPGVRAGIERIAFAAGEADAFLVAVGRHGNADVYNWRGIHVARQAHVPRATDMAGAVSGTGRLWVASASGDPVARVWTAMPGEAEVVVSSATTGVGIAAVHAAGRTFALSFGPDGRLSLWDPVAGKDLPRLAGPPGRTVAVTAVRTPDDRPLGIAALANQQMHVWDLGTGRLLYTMRSPGTGFAALTAAAGPGVTAALAVSADGLAQAWDVVSRKVLGRVYLPRQMTAAGLAHTAQRGWVLVAGFEDGHLGMWRMDTGAQICWLAQKRGKVAAVTAVPGLDHQLIVLVGTHGGWMHFVRFPEQVQLNSLGQIADDVMAATPTADSATALIVSSNGLREYSSVRQRWLKRRVGVDAGVVDAAGVVSDGGTRLAVTLDIDGCRSVWDMELGVRLHRLEPNDSAARRHRVRCTALPGDRDLATITDAEGRVRVYDLNGRRRLPTPLHYGSDVTAALAADVDGDVMITAHADGRIRVWELHIGYAIRTFGAHPQPVGDIVVSEVDGRVLVVSTCGDEVARVWDARTGELVHLLSGHRAAIVEAAVGSGPDQSLLVTAARDTTARAWDLRTGLPVGRPYELTFEPVGVAVGEIYGETAAIAVSGLGTVLAWHPPTGEQVATMRHNRPFAVRHATLLSGDAVVVTANYDGISRVRDVSTGNLVRAVRAESPVVDTATATLGSGLPVVVVVSLDGSVTLTYLDALDAEADDERHSDRVISVAFSRYTDDIEVVVTGGRDGELRYWRGGSGAPAGKVTHPDWVTGIATTQVRGQPVIVTTCDDGAVRMLHRANLTHALKGHTSWVTGVACAEHEKTTLAVTTSHDRTVRVWDLNENRELRQLFGHRFGAAAVACTDLGGVPAAVTAGQDGAVAVWDLASGKRLRTIGCHGGRLTGVACARAVMLVGGDEGVACLWDVATGEHLRCLVTDEPPIIGVAAGVSGGRPVFAIASADTVRVWGSLDGGPFSIAMPEEVGAIALSSHGELAVGYGAEVALLRLVERANDY